MKLSYSEADTLASCEERWYRKYVQKQPDSPGRGLQLGTLLHVGDRSWINGDGWYIPIDWVDDYTGETVFTDSFPADVVDDAHWLGERWVEHYGDHPPADWEIVSTEEWVSFAYDMGWALEQLHVAARIDGLIRIDGKLWLRELKSYGRGSRLDIVEVSPQETIYVKGVEELYGERPFGILFDGIYTYRWKRDEHPPADSFQRVFTDRSDEQIAKAMTWLKRVASRKDAILSDAWEHEPQQPVANIGTGCRSCPYRPQCWNDMLGVAEDEIEVEEGE